MASDQTKPKRPRIIIRTMTIDDIPSVYHLGEQLFTSDELPILYRTWDPYEVTDAFSDDPEFCFIAEHEDRVVGFLLGTTVEKEGTAWKKYGYLSWIGVDEEYQRYGLGLRLYQKLERKLKDEGIRMMMADTEANNREAIPFFQSMGFSIRSQYVWLAKTLRKSSKRSKKAE